MTAAQQTEPGAARPALAQAPAIVKFGGSLASAPRRLRALLHEVLLAVAGGHRPVLVPGGGPFADAVRAAQQRYACDDSVAHDMALLAMAQYGLLLGALAPLHCALGLEAVRAATGATAPSNIGRACIWLPDPQCDALDVARTWRITSDYLALWLANQIGARQVVLVKSCAPPPSGDLAALAQAGIIDAAYPELAASLPEVVTTLVFDANASALRAALANAS